MKKLLTLRHSKSLLMMLFISLIVCSGCKKEKDSYFHHKISKDLYPLLFNEGSYWIYKNSETSILDTVVLTSIKIDTVVYGPSGPGQGSPGEEQVYVLNYNSSQFGVYRRTLREDYICSGWMVGGQPTGVEYLSSHKIGHEYQGAEIADIYDSFIVNGKSYSNVVLMKLNAFACSDCKMKNLYYADYVGIVKKIITKDDDSFETWELLEFNVTLHVVNP